MSNQNASASDLATIEEKYDSITAVVIRRLSVAMFVLTVSVLYLSFRMPLAPDAGLWAGAYLGVSVALYLLQRFGRMRLAAICLVASLWLAATVAIGRYSGVGGMLFACYIVITFLAAVVMRSNRWLIVLLVCVLSGGVLYGAEAQGFWTPRGYGPAAPWFPVAFQVSLLLVTSSLIMWGRQQVGTALQALRVKNSELEMNQALLETRSAESEATSARLQLESEQRRQSMEKLRKVESALRASEKRYRTVFEHDPNAIIVADMLTQQIIDVNSSTTRLFGYTRDSLLSMAMPQLSPESQPDWVGADADLRAADTATFTALSIYEWVFAKSDGQDFPAEVRMVRLPTMEGQQLFQLSIVDITERHYALHALRESEARYRTLVENAPDAILVFDVDKHCVVEANENAAMLFGRSRVELMASDVEDVIPLDSADSTHLSFDAIAAGLDEGEQTRIEFTFEVADDGNEKHAFEAHIVRLPAGSRKLLRASIIDVSRRRSAEKMLDAMPGCVAVLTHSGDLLWVNASFHERFGTTEETVLGETIQRFLSLWDFEEILYELEDEDGLRRFDLTAQTARGHAIPQSTRSSIIEYHSRPAILLSFEPVETDAVDVARESRMAEEIRLTQQQGRDMQQLIGLLLNQTTIALSKMENSAESRRHIEKSLHAARQMSQIGSATFGEPLAAQIAVRNLNVNALIETNQQMFALIAGEHLAMNYELSDSVPLIHADSDLIKRAITGLVLNATEAIGGASGQIDIVSDVVTISANAQSDWIAQTGRLLKPGSYVRIAVTDNGLGHSPLALRRLFDPSQGGSGARMAAIVRVVRGHRGGLRATSGEQEGSTFELIFPVVGEQTVESKPPILLPEPAD